MKATDLRFVFSFSIYLLLQPMRQAPQVLSHEKGPYLLVPPPTHFIAHITSRKD